jgi:RNA polymerase sigma-70 factor (family 1)
LTENQPIYTSYNEKDLLQRIAEGDETAFAALFNHYQRRLFSVAIDLTHSMEVAEELIQDVFLKVWLKRTQLPLLESFPSFIFIVMRNEAYDWLSTQNRRKKILKEMPSDNMILPELPLELLQKKELASIISKGLQRLPEQQREIFRKMRIEGLSRDEAAISLGINANTAKTHMSRAIKALRAWCIMHGELLIIIPALKYF